MKIYVGNMSFKTSQDALQSAFEAHGEVQEVAIVNDRETGRPRGFAFVTMPDDNQARAAIDALNGQELDGRVLTVNEAKPREGGSRGGFGGGGGGGGRSGGGRGGYGGGGGGGGRSGGGRGGDRGGW